MEYSRKQPKVRREDCYKEYILPTKTRGPRGQYIGYDGYRYTIVEYKPNWRDTRYGAVRERVVIRGNFR